MGTIYKNYIAHPRLICLIGKKNDDEVNFMIAAWHTYLSHTFTLYGATIGNTRHTYEPKIKSQEYSVSFLLIEYILKIHSMGKLTGIIYDKLGLVNSKISSCKKNTALYLSEAYGVMECKVVNFIKTGGHTMFVSEIVHFHGDHEVYDDNGVIYTNKAMPIMYIGKNNYITTEVDSEKHFAMDE